MVISATEILGTIPLGTVWIVKAAKSGVTPWRGWAVTHENYSAVHQIPASIWKNNPNSVFALEVYRWSLVLCAFLFFALFGFADEARQHYCRMCSFIASRVGLSKAYVIHSLCWVVRLVVTHVVFLAVRRRSLTRRAKVVCWSPL
jgi:pheromone a factor receptor